MGNLELYMVGLIVEDMGRAVEFYRRLGVAVPEGAESKSHVEVKMGGLTFFLDSRPDRWDPDFARETTEAGDGYRSVLEFYLGDQSAVDAKYAQMTGLGYRGLRPPYDTGFGMRFAMLHDPDGNTLLLSGDLAKP